MNEGVFRERPEVSPRDVIWPTVHTCSGAKSERSAIGSGPGDGARMLASAPAASRQSTLIRASACLPEISIEPPTRTAFAKTTIGRWQTGPGFGGETRDTIRRSNVDVVRTGVSSSECELRCRVGASQG